MEERVANGEEIGFGNAEIPVEDFNELALDPSDIALAEGAGNHSPVNVFQSRVVGVFGSDDESAEENAVQCPLFGLDGEVWPGAFDVDEGDEDVGESGLGSLDDCRDELGKFGVLVGAGGRTSARRRGRWDTEGVVDDFDSRLHDLF